VTAGILMDAIRPHLESGQVPGAVVGVLRDGEVSLDVSGTTEPGGGTPMTVDELMRISSNTKPMAAALALSLAEDGVLALDDPVERFLPELVGRRVLRRLDGPLDDTVPAERPVTVDDLLSMRLGFGFVFEGDCPAVAAAAEAGLGIGPPDPSIPLTPDAWIARFAELPLLEQPGTVWRYDLAYGVLSVLLARAGGHPLDVLLRARLLDPLGMADTGFVAPPGRLPPCFAVTEAGLVLFDEATESRWETPPAFPDARGGLVSTATDLLRFAGALLDGGGGVVSADSVEAMTTDRLTPEQRRGPSAQVFLDDGGWGYGVQVVTPEHDPSVRIPRYGWGGGLGTLCYSWPRHGTAAVLLTQVLPPSGELIRAFIRSIETTLDASGADVPDK
jgi:CubicO group peptidase (beta-lactamase class C family)